MAPLLLLELRDGRPIGRAAIGDRDRELAPRSRAGDGGTMKSGVGVEDRERGIGMTDR